MGVGKKHKLVLFALGLYLREANKRFSNQPLEVSVSKVHFIDIVKKAKIIEKSDRALYRNLEVLEKSRFLSYKNRALSMTKKGFNLFGKISKETEPFIAIKDTVKKGLPGTKKKAQARFIK